MEALIGIVWFRRDLRLSDHPALDAARRRSSRLIPLFILGSEADGSVPSGEAARGWLHNSLIALDIDLRQKGSRLILRRGDPAVVLRRLAIESGAREIHCNRVHEPAAQTFEEALRTRLAQQGLPLTLYPGDLLHQPGSILTRNGTPHRAFAPFWRACRQQPAPTSPLPRPRQLPPLPGAVASVSVDALGLLPRKRSAAGSAEPGQPHPGERHAHARLEAFCGLALAGYTTQRDQLDLEGTSRLSPHLHFGELSPRQLLHRVQRSIAEQHAPGIVASGEEFLRQLYWREFTCHTLHHFPDLPTRPLDRRFERFPWQADPEPLKAWQQGRTGIPLVDAAMRQLWHSGWIHNRARLVAASFLAKNLLLAWQDGAAWFLDTLVDADLANNSFNWQWVAGCGIAAAPFFRIFNPLAQAERFDPRGDYVRRWLPELGSLPTPFIHAPWQAPTQLLAASGVRLGQSYPLPIVDLKSSRERALAAFRAIRVAPQRQMKRAALRKQQKR